MESPESSKDRDGGGGGLLQPPHIFPVRDIIYPKPLKVGSRASGASSIFSAFVFSIYFYGTFSNNCDATIRLLGSVFSVWLAGSSSHISALSE